MTILYVVGNRKLVDRDDLRMRGWTEVSIAELEPDDYEPIEGPRWLRERYLYHIDRVSSVERTERFRKSVNRRRARAKRSALAKTCWNSRRRRRLEAIGVNHYDIEAILVNLKRLFILDSTDMLVCQLGKHTYRVLSPLGLTKRFVCRAKKGLKRECLKAIVELRVEARECEG
jgi:hypothetical protein